MARTLAEGLLDLAVSRGWLAPAEAEALLREARGDPGALYGLLQPRLAPAHLEELVRASQGQDGSPSLAAAPTLPPRHAVPGGPTRAPPSDRLPTAVQSSDRLPVVTPATVALRQEAVRHYREACRHDPLFSPHADDALERLDELGRGGMGVVLRVRDRRLGREAALKLVQAPALGDAALLRFRREVEVTARLDHPGVPPVYEAGTDGQGRHYLLMRVIQGESLGKRISALHGRGQSAGARLAGAAFVRARRELLEALVKVGETVAYAHGRGIVHRDLKPENVMLGRFGEVMVLDWGLARDLARPEEPALATPEAVQAAAIGGEAAALTQAGAVLGTPGYMPPEQAGGEPVDQRADVFALGAVLCELLSGKRPIEGQTAMNRISATVQGKIKTPRQLRRDVPRELDSLAAAALWPDPQGRLASAEAFVADLRAWLAGERLATHAYSPPELAGRWVRRHPRLLLSLAALGLALAVVVGAAARLREAESERLRVAEVDRAFELLAQADYLAGNPAQAAAVGSAVREALALGRDSRQVRWLAARAYQAAGLTAEAEGLLKSTADDPAVREGPDPPYREMYALARLEQEARGDTEWSNWDEELRKLAMRRGDQDSVDLVLWTRGVAAKNEGRQAEALELFGRALELNPRLKWARFTRAVLRRELGQPQAALEDCDEALRIDPRFGRAWLERALICAVQKDEPGCAVAMLTARGCFSRAESPRLAQGLLYLAQLYKEWGELPRAVRALEEAARQLESLQDEAARAPQGSTLRSAIGVLSVVYYQRGQLRLLLGAPREALPDLDRVVERDDPQLALRARGDRASARIACGDLAGAQADVDAALAAAPADKTALLASVELRRRRGDQAGALADARRAAQAHPQDVDALLALGAMLSLTGQHPAAIEALGRATELAPERPEAWFCLGTARVEAGQHRAALADLQRALELHPRHADAWFELAVALDALGDRPHAIEAIRRGLDSGPNPTSAATWRQRLQELERR